MKGFISKFKSLPEKNKKLISLSIILFLVLSIPILLWGFLTGRFDLRKRASIPVTPPETTAVNWNTGKILIHADEFSIVSNNKYYSPNGDYMNISSSYSSTNQHEIAEIQVKSNQYGDTLMLKIGFRSDGTYWWVDYADVYNSNYADKWVRYTVWKLETPVGNPFYFSGLYDFALMDPQTNQTIANVHFKNLKVHGFYDKTPNPTACYNQTFGLELTPLNQVGVAGETKRYAIKVTNPNTHCNPYHVTLIADNPSNWTTAFGDATFVLSGNNSFETYLDVTSASTNYSLGKQEIPIRVMTTEVGPMANGNVYYEVVDQPLPTVTPAPKTGDINGDGHVNIVDIGIIIDHYRTTPPGDPRADLNNDGTINIVDIGIVINNYEI